MEEVFNFLKEIESENKYLKEVKKQLEKKYIELQGKYHKLESILSYDSIYYRCYNCKGWFSGDYDNGLYDTPRKSWLKWNGSEPGGIYEDLDYDLKKRIICVECFQKIFPHNSNGEVINTETDEINPNLLYETKEGSFPSKGIHDFDYYIINPDNFEEEQDEKIPSHLYNESVKPVSDELRKFLHLGTNYLISMREVHCRIVDYCKINNLQDPEDLRRIIPDTSLKELLKLDENTEITFFTLGKYIRKIY